MAHPYFDLERPFVLGHRGAAGERPENTLPSFERGLALGAQVLESDLQVTRDGVPVLMHDEEVDRTTDGSGPAAALTWNELQRLDAGHRFTTDEGRTFPFRGVGVRIPSLEEAFRAFPEARFNLEIKDDRNGLVEQVVELVRLLDRGARTLLTAGEPRIMESLRAKLRHRGGPAIGASSADVLAFVRSALDDTAPSGGAMALQIPPDFGGRPLITSELVAHAHQHDVQVHAWTINDPKEAVRLLDLGVDGLVTDFPGVIATLIASRRGST